MGVLAWFGVFIPTVITLYYTYNSDLTPATHLDLVNGPWWGQGDELPEAERSPDVWPFDIQLTAETLDNFQQRLFSATIFESLSDTEFELGVKSGYMRSVVDYWAERFAWRRREVMLNKYAQYTTDIEGLNLHFLHVRPLANTSKTVPLLAIHGWPGSVYEFTKLISMLVDSNRLPKGLNFELVIPSIPGHGFSAAPAKQGFDAFAAARMFVKLMTRLGYARFYVLGNNWGSVIAKVIAQLYGSHVRGLQLTVVPPRLGSAPSPAREAVGAIFPPLIYTVEELRARPALREQFVRSVEEQGYMHIELTRPDTVAYGLVDSPVALCAYILEQYSAWGKFENRFCVDDCLLSSHFTLDEVLTNVMMYWLTGHVASSIRFYRENFASRNLSLINSLPVNVPTAISSFPDELMPNSEPEARLSFRNLLQYTRQERGGHFAAMEEPRLLADDVIAFVQLVERRQHKGWF